MVRRRDALRLCAGALTALSGCLADGDASGETPGGGNTEDDPQPDRDEPFDESPPGETRPIDGEHDAIATTGLSPPLPGRQHVALLASGEEAWFDDEELVGFVSETDFDQAVVLLFQARHPAPCHAYGFESFARTDDYLVATVDEERNGEGCAAAEAYAAYLVRVPIDDPAPTRAAVRTGGATFTNRYAVELERVADDPAGADVADVESLDPAARDPILDAIKAGTTDLSQVPEGLARSLARFDYYAYEGDYYALAAVVPEHVLTGEIRRDVEDDADVIDLRDVREDDPAAFDAIAEAMGGEYRSPYLPPTVEAVLAEYDYVRRRPTYVELGHAVDDPGRPYELSAERVPDEEVEGAIPSNGGQVPVTDVGELPDGVREEVTAALDGPITVTNSPALLRTGAYRSYVRIEGAVYRPLVRDLVGTNHEVHAPDRH